MHKRTSTSRSMKTEKLSHPAEMTEVQDIKAEEQHQEEEDRLTWIESMTEKVEAVHIISLIY